MPTTTKTTVQVGYSTYMTVTVPLANDKDMRNWLIEVKDVATCVSNDWTNHVDKEITVSYLVRHRKEQDFYKAVEEWCQQKGYSVQLPEPTQ